MTETWVLATIWLGLALLATLLSIWLRIATALSEIVVGTVILLIVGAVIGPERGKSLLGTDQSWVTFLSGTGAIVLTFLAGAELDPTVFRAKWKEAADPETLEQAMAAYNAIQWQFGHIVDEIETCIRYHTSLARGSQIERLVFLGPEARDRALVRVLGAHLNIACDTGRPL